jgi:hypothetical protein
LNWPFKTRRLKNGQKRSFMFSVAGILSKEDQLHKKLRTSVHTGFKLRNIKVVCPNGDVGTHEYASLTVGNNVLLYLNNEWIASSSNQKLGTEWRKLCG